ncbi:hypothetical protein VCR4J2_750462 [Vibrio coralliirubri]|nr:hypothetical protein VCR4J2_750462 [Vibrio coralliirubri]
MSVLCWRSYFESLYPSRTMDSGELNDDCYDSLFDERIFYLF